MSQIWDIKRCIIIAEKSKTLYKKENVIMITFQATSFTITKKH